jgi:5-methylcytosine-specific restriction endonuclease McrA
MVSVAPYNSRTGSDCDAPHAARQRIMDMREQDKLLFYVHLKTHGQCIETQSRERDRVFLRELDTVYSSVACAEAEIAKAVQNEYNARTVMLWEQGVHPNGVAGYCLRSSRLWTSRRLLTHEQWDTLIQRATTYEDALINSVMTGRRPDSPDTRFIPSAVRREVWVRDGGICVQCGSKERLEFDHIIPVAMGGSNTTRNIQLLCEVCNREKSATLG